MSKKKKHKPTYQILNGKATPVKREYTDESYGLGTPPGQSLESLFVQLCAYTTPHGTEWMLMRFLPRGTYWDTKGNGHVLVQNPDGSDPVVQFCSHLDTACSAMEEVTMLRCGDDIVTNGKTVLGADCKIGVAIMLKMIEAGIPGWYVFHVGEERGCIGAHCLEKNQDLWWIKPRISVEFDRHSYGSIITFQRGMRCCSEQFSAALAAQLPMPEKYKQFGSDNGGLYTDNGCYMELIPEVTNLSVGYYGHHSTSEKQDIVYATLLLEQLLKVKWDQLPVVRDPKVRESKYPAVQSYYGNGQAYNGGYHVRPGSWEDDENYMFPRSDSATRVAPSGATTVGHNGGYTNLKEWDKRNEAERLANHNATVEAIKNSTTKATNLLAECQKLEAETQKYLKEEEERKAGGWTPFLVVNCPHCHKVKTVSAMEFKHGETFPCHDCGADLSDEVNQEYELLTELNARYSPNKTVKSLS